MSNSAEYKLTTVVIPTRNRTDIAKNAIRSVLDQPGCDVRVMVSDNSTDPAQLQELDQYCTQLDDSRLRYVRPPAPLGMTPHWEWAIQEALQFYDASHFIYLTDRMMFKPRALKEVLDLAALYPGKIISYNHGKIVDDRRPVRIEQDSQTGELFEVKTLNLSYLYSQSYFLPALPRMLNCVVPRSVLKRMGQRFGNIFASVAPDLHFSCRCLEMEESILFYDKSPIFHYALTLSHGASVTRGEATAATADFTANLPVDSSLRNHATPIPQLLTTTNMVINEYLVFKQETKSSRFYEVDLQRYLLANAREITEVIDPKLKAEQLGLLEAHGLAGASNGLKPDRSARVIIRKLLSPHAVLNKVTWLAGDNAFKPLWLLLARSFGIAPPNHNRFEFDQIEDAISYLQKFEARRARRVRWPDNLPELRVLSRSKPGSVV